MTTQRKTRCRLEIYRRQNKEGDKLIRGRWGKHGEEESKAAVPRWRRLERLLQVNQIALFQQRQILWSWVEASCGILIFESLPSRLVDVSHRAQVCKPTLHVQCVGATLLLLCQLGSYTNSSHQHRTWSLVYQIKTR